MSVSVADPQEQQGISLPERLPSLREDVSLREGARALDGSPTWLLYDPVRNKYFQINRAGMAIIRCWDLHHPEQVIAAAAAIAREPISPVDVSHMLDFLVGAELIDGHSVPIRTRLQKLGGARVQTLFQKLLHGYLFFRIPLVKPDHFLDQLYPHLRLVFSRRFVLFTVVVGVISMVLISRQWSTFTGTFSWLFSIEGAIGFFLTLVFVKIVHELGHALALKRHGLKVPTMGVAFMVMWPVLYTDATDGWQLRRRHEKAVISAAGVSAELMLACYAMAAWVLLPDGIGRSLAFTVATTTWVLSLAVNLNPLMRFDGYFFLSDILNVPNLQDRSFAQARWRLRTWLFGDIGERPDVLSTRMANFLAGYGFAVWVYRFLLFLGIALLVYHLFFKALGVALFIVEIWFFIVRPLRNEIKHWPGLFSGMDTVRKKRWFVLLGVMLLILAFPFEQNIRLPAQVVDAEFTRIYPPVPARVAEVLVGHGQVVDKGAPLLRLVSPRLDFDLQQARSRLAEFQGKLNQTAIDTDRLEERLVLEQAVQRAASEIQALQRTLDSLLIRSPGNGLVADMNSELLPGLWLSREQHLLTIRGGKQAHYIAWATEEQLSGLSVDKQAVFFAPANVSMRAHPVRITKIERSAVSELQPYHASVHGGDIPVDAGQDGRLVPRQAIYRVHLTADGSGADWLPDQRLRGHVSIEGSSKTLAGMLFRVVAGTFIRESGF